MRDYLIAMLVIPVLFGAWIVVQRIVKEFALRHPEFGPPREEGGGELLRDGARLRLGRAFTRFGRGAALPDGGLIADRGSVSVSDQEDLVPVVYYSACTGNVLALRYEQP